MDQVLIVEEDPFLAELAAIKLMGAGYGVTVQKDGELVMPFLAAQHVDVILLDLNLPNLDGLTILKRIRDNGPTAHLPVLVFTNDDSGDVRDAVIALGGKYYLKATTGTDELLTAVEDCLR